MRSRKSRLNEVVTWIRTAGAVNTLWGFLKSPMAAVYLWGPFLTIWGLVGGLRENVATPYLLVTCTLIFGGICWSATQVGSLRDRFTDRYKKLRVIFDRAIPSCRADVTFGDGSHAICFRLQVENESTSKLEQCEAWIESADRFPNISPFRLFWAGDTVVLTSGIPRIIQSMSVDLIKNVPRFV